jgi:hypothetical protein
MSGVPALALPNMSTSVGLRGSRSVIDAREHGHALCLDLGFEPIHGFLRAVAARYRRQSICGHGMRSQKKNPGNDRDELADRRSTHH